MTIAKAFWTVAPGHGEIREEILAPPNAAETRLHALASGVSRGTEALVFAGAVPPSQYDIMRAPLMGGTFPGPVKYGYSTVASAPSGQRVFVLHPHQDVFNAPTAMCIPVPDTVPTARAVLGANMETAVNILWDAAPLVGERILVIGAGVVGLLAGALSAQIPGTQVTLVDIDPARARLAEPFGCRFALPNDAPRDQDLVIHASASEAGLRLALSHAGYEARIIEASWFGANSPNIPLGEAFHSRRLRLIATQVGAVAPAMRGRRSFGERLALALGLLADPSFDALLDGPTRFEAMPAAMPAILATGGLCHVITHGTEITI